MSKNVPSDSEKKRKPVNPQETLEEKKYYYSGLCAGEMSCSVIKATNHNPAGHYYAIDFTVSNADKDLLQDVNKVVMKGNGIISPIKGAYNLSARGKKRVRIAMDFLDRHPIIIGDLAKNRIEILKDTLKYLEEYRGSSHSKSKELAMDEVRQNLRKIKRTGEALKPYKQESVDKNIIGYFLAGVLDGEGSFGFKQSGTRKQPFFNVAMKDQKIIELFRDFLKHGKVRFRKDGVYHYEINHQEVLKNVCIIFLTKYPLKHARQRERLQRLQRILNDYTRDPATSLKERCGSDIV